MNQRSRVAISGPAPKALLLVLTACAADHYARDADREVGAILRDRTAHTVGQREANAARPPTKTPVPPVQAEGAVPAAPDSSSAAEAPPPIVPSARMLSLQDALEIAFRSNRELIAQQELLYLTVLSLTGTHYEFSPRVSATLSYVFAGSDAEAETHDLGVGGEVAQKLPWGGEASFGVDTGFTGSSENTFSSSANFTLAQPLLRGAGREVAWETLRQAERSLVYAIRDFELFRESFSIDVAKRFYELVGQKQALENQRQNLKAFVLAREQAEALFGVGLQAQLEVLRARRSELVSQNSLIEAEEALRLALARFRIFLGLPEDDPVDVRDEEPPLLLVDYAIEPAIEVALVNRLDWLNRQEQLDDARRGVRIAKNGLLPDLALDLTYNLDGEGDGDSAFTQPDVDDESYSAGLTLKLPIQQVVERNEFRRAEIALANATRAVAEFKDDLIVSLRSAFRELERRKQSIAIQTELIIDQERNVEIAQLLLEKGGGSNRDVLEAQQAVLDARNALIGEKVAYEIARLGLLKDLGILFIDEKGMWKE